MKKLALFILLSVVFWACGGDETTTIVEDARTGFDVVRNMDGLGRCDSDHVADIAYVKDSSKTFFCNGKKWRSVDGKDGKDGKDGVDGKDGKNGKNGLDGYRGSTCSVSNEGDLYTLVCGQDTVVVNTHLVTPSACTTVKNEDGTVTLKCSDKSATVLRGKDGEDAPTCKYIDNEDGTMMQVCGDVSVKIYGDFCGETPYDADEYFCDGITVLRKCGGKVYNPRVQDCIDDEVRELCGSSYYDPETQSCTESALLFEHCGGDTYDPLVAFCFEDKIYPFCTKELDVPYDVSMYHCDGGRIVGSVEDKDGNVYRTVLIDGVEWMAENYRLKVDGSLCASEFADSLTFDEYPKYYKDKRDLYEYAKQVDCNKEGRTYSWNVVMGLDQEYNFKLAGDLVKENHQGICPDGWHVPTRAELESYIESSFFSDDVWRTEFERERSGGFEYISGELSNYYKGTYFVSATENAETPNEVSWYGIDQHSTGNSDGKSDHDALRCVRNPKVQEVAAEEEGE